MEQKSLLNRWRANFLTGLVIVLPAVISMALLVEFPREGMYSLGFPTSEDHPEVSLRAQFTI